MPKRKGKEYYCNIVSESVKIALKTKPSLSRTFKDELFVQCDQFECQYAEENKNPCPLTLTLFAKEIEEREEKRKIRVKELYY